MWGYVKERVVKARTKIINELKLEIERETRFINNDLCGTAIKKKGDCKSASRDLLLLLPTKSLSFHSLDNAREMN